MNRLTSVCIPTWNSLEYLKICYKGIMDNSSLPVEVIVHDNGSDDGTVEWLKEKGIKHTTVEENKGICYGLNRCLEIAEGKYAMFMHTDMYPLPEWDSHMVILAEEFEDGRFLFCSRSIEPTGNDPHHLILDYGRDNESFQEDKLISDHSLGNFSTGGKIITAHRMPIFFTVDKWKEIGGFDESFCTWAADDDKVMEFYDAGVRNFLMPCDSLVYHFQGKTDAKLKGREKLIDPDPDAHFIRKWSDKYPGITINELNRMGDNKYIVKLQTFREGK